MGKQEAGIGLARLLRPGAGDVLDNSGQIKDKNDAAVAQDRGAGNKIGQEGLIVERFDDQFFFTFERVDDKSVFLFCDRDHEHEEFAFAVSVGSGAAETEQRQHLVAELEDFVVVHLMDFGLDGASDLKNGVQRDRVETLLDPEQQSLDDSQRKRQFQAESSSLPEASFEADRGFQAVQDALHDVHANAAFGNFGDLFRRGETRTEDEVE